jgi:hypothetical protein
MVRAMAGNGGSGSRERLRSALVGGIAAWVVLVCVSGALAAAELRSPADGAVIDDDRPDFSWVLPDGEEARWITIADSPDVIFDGSFSQNHVVDDAGLTSSRSSWSPLRRLLAGTVAASDTASILEPVARVPARPLVRG